MKQEVYLCEQKGTTFIVVDTEENIQQAIERDKDENRSEFVKYLQRNDPSGFNEFRARKLNLSKDKIKEPLGISFLGVEETDVEYLNSQVEHLNINKINIRDSKLDIPLPEHITDNVKTFFCGGKVKGVIDLDLYKNLEEINILDWDTKIKFKNDSKKNNIRKLVVWYHNPKEKTLKTLTEFLYNLEILEINHTNIETLEGIENLRFLKEIEIQYGRNLKQVNYLNECKKLEKVFFNNCKKIEDMEKLHQREGLYIRKAALSG